MAWFRVCLTAGMTPNEMAARTKVSNPSVRAAIFQPTNRSLTASNHDYGIATLAILDGTLSFPDPSTLSTM
jgi:hypothetical protein